MAIEKLKINCKTQKWNWTNPHIKNHVHSVNSDWSYHRHNAKIQNTYIWNS